MSRLDDKLAALATLSGLQLRAEWQRLHKAPAPRVSLDLLARGIAWQLQERALGGLPPSASRELKRLSANSAISDVRGAITTAPVQTSAADLRPGTTLMRTWGDRNWSVLITEEGLVFEGRRYDSLSKIAREITGAHWSGPRFFGLKAASAKCTKVSADA
jgi:hypothetical protein